MQSTWQKAGNTHSIEVQIIVIVLLLSTKAIHAQSKGTFNWNREGDSSGSHCSARETFVNQSLSWEWYVMPFEVCLCFVWLKSNQQIHFLGNVLIKLFICVEPWCGSLHTKNHFITHKGQYPKLSIQMFKHKIRYIPHGCLSTLWS